MKIVVCKNCGTNFQIEDYEDINTYECSICAGDLEYDTNFSTLPSSETTQRFNTDRLTKSYYMVQCENCGLKYKLDKTDNILDYECSGCGGELKYLDNALNQELKGIRQQQQAYKEFLQNNYSADSGNSDAKFPPYDDDDYIIVDHSARDDEEESADYGTVENSGYIENGNEYPYNEFKDDIVANKSIDVNSYEIDESTSYITNEDNFNSDSSEDLDKREYESKYKVPNSLDYNELKNYLIFTYAENMDNLYNSYYEDLKKKLKI